MGKQQKSFKNRDRGSNRRTASAQATAGQGARNPYSAHDAAYARWAEGVAKERQTKRVEGDLGAYAYALIDAPAHSDAGVKIGTESYALPKVALLAGAQSSMLTCGLPASIGCCRHDTVARDYAVAGTSVVGLCGKAGYFFRKTRRELSDAGVLHAGLNRLRTYATPVDAQWVADHRAGLHDRDPQLKCPICSRGRARR